MSRSTASRPRPPPTTGSDCSKAHPRSCRAGAGRIRCSIADPPQALAVGAGPQIAVARFAQHHGIVVQLRSAGITVRCRPPSSSLTPAGEATHKPSAAVLKIVERNAAVQRIVHNRIHEVAVVHSAGAAAGRDQQVAVMVLANGKYLVARQAVLLCIRAHRLPVFHCTRPRS